MSTDSDIIRQARESPEAFAELYDRHASAIFRYAARRAGEFVADDVTSETFLIAFEQLSTFDHRKVDALPWLLGIATNLLRRHHRAEFRTLRALAKSASRESIADDTDLITARIDANAATARMALALKNMPAVDRETLLLYAWADLSYEAIAIAMDVPLGTVRSRLNRARKKLRTKLNMEALLEETEDDHGRPAAASRHA